MAAPRSDASAEVAAIDVLLVSMGSLVSSLRVTVDLPLKVIVYLAEALPEPADGACPV